MEVPQIHLQYSKLFHSNLVYNIPNDCILCFLLGSLAIIDTHTCSQVHSLSDLGTISSLSIEASAGCTTIAVVSSYERPFGGGGGGGGGTSTVTLLVARGNGEWERQILSMPSDCGNSLNPVSGAFAFVTVH